MLSCPWRVERLPVFEHPDAVGLMVRTDEIGFEEIRQVHNAIRLPEEIQSAVRSRQIEFFAGRLLATLALEMLGSTHTSVAIGNHREPVWPAGFSGSISHSQNVVAALMLRSTNQVVGLDIEHQIPSDQCESLKDVLNQDELNVLAQEGLNKAESFTLGFSVKETLFKAIFPRVKRYLDFDQSTVLNIDHNRNRVGVELHVDGLSRLYWVSFVDLGIFSITSMIAPADW